MFQKAFVARARKRGLLMITDKVAQIVGESGVATGLANVFIQHTSASLTISENADPSARSDLESFIDRLAPEDEPWYTHMTEGPDDMPSHLKSIVTDTSLVIPVTRGALALGVWQGIYLWEHRDDPPQRSIVITVW